jgi:hypothetical protein
MVKITNHLHQTADTCCLLSLTVLVQLNMLFNMRNIHKTKISCVTQCDNTLFS